LRGGIADGSGLLVRDNFGRFVVSATTEEAMLMLVVPLVGMSIAVWVLVLKEDLMVSWPTWRRWRSKSLFPAVY